MLSAPHLDLSYHPDARTRLLTGPSGLQPIRKAHGLNIDETVEVQITKIESAFGGGNEGVKTELLTHVLRYLRVGEGVLQSPWCVVRSFKVLP